MGLHQAHTPCWHHDDAHRCIGVTCTAGTLPPCLHTITSPFYAAAAAGSSHCNSFLKLSNSSCQFNSQCDAELKQLQIWSLERSCNMLPAHSVGTVKSSKAHIAALAQHISCALGRTMAGSACRTISQILPHDQYGHMAVKLAATCHCAYILSLYCLDCSANVSPMSTSTDCRQAHS